MHSRKNAPKKKRIIKGGASSTGESTQESGERRSRGNGRRKFLRKFGVGLAKPNKKKTSLERPQTKFQKRRRNTGLKSLEKEVAQAVEIFRTQPPSQTKKIRRASRVGQKKNTKKRQRTFQGEGVQRETGSRLWGPVKKSRNKHAKRRRNRWNH